MDTRIYIMTHKEFAKPEDDIYHFLHVGKAGKNDLGYVGDDTGDNISDKNKNYCELTGMYWLWKNVSCDIIGICHYRRYLIREQYFLTKEYIEETLKDYDIILPSSNCTEDVSIIDHYTNNHVGKDLLECGNIIEEIYPEYKQAFDISINCNLMTVGNIIITRKDIYDDYCKWLFDILFELEKRTDISDYDDYQQRIMGFLSERLLRVWLLKHEYKIKEETCEMVDPQDVYNGIRSVELKYRYVELVLAKVIDNYKSKVNTDSNSIIKRENDKEKIPVWVCWWQGMENAPELVKMCLSSLEKHLPKDYAKIKIITFENVAEYVQFPDYIVEKFNQGIITMTHLSDILRAELLYRYGGMWIDSTYFVAKDIEKDIFLSDKFFTQKAGYSIWKSDIVKGRWSGNLLKGNAGDILFCFMKDAFYEYWKNQSSLIDYFLIDYIIAIAYNNIKQVRDDIDQCEINGINTFAFRDIINKKYNARKFNEIIKNTTFFKLNYRNELQPKNVIGEDTYWGYMKNQMEE